MTNPKRTCTGVLGDPVLLQENAKLCDLLLNESFTNGTNFEKLETSSGPGLYTMRVDQRRRLLVTRDTILGKSYWVVLARLDKHKSNESPFLKKGYLANYLARQRPVLEQQIITGNFNKQLAESLTPPVPPEEKLSTTEAENNLTELEVFNDKLIALNDIQKQVLESKQPLIVSGMPGTGKSVLALAILVKNLESMDAQSEASSRRLYLTLMPELKKSMQDGWKNSPSYDPQKPNAIEFKTYEELINELKPETKALKKVNGDKFVEWIGPYLKKKPGFAAILKGCLPHDVNIAQFLHQECRMMVHQDSYRSLPKEESLFYPAGLTPDETNNFRCQTFQIVLDYRNFLRQKKYVDYALCHFDLPPAICDQIVLDESQDFSHIQLNAVAKIPKRDGMTVFLGDKQGKDYLPKLPYVKRMLKGSSYFELAYSLRCAKAIVVFANVLLKIENFLTGCTPDRPIPTEIEDKSLPEAVIPKLPAGEVIGVDVACGMTSDEVGVKEAKSYPKIRSADFAIIANEKWTIEVREKYPGAIVLTPGQAKGLEFKEVMLYNPFNDPAFKPIDPLLAHYENDVKKYGNRVKKGQEHPEYGPILRELFSAAMRATDKVYLYNQATHYISNIETIIEPCITKRIKSTDSIGSTLPESSPELWLDRAKQFVKREDHREKNEEAAWIICRDHLGYNKDAFQNFMQEVRAKKTGSTSPTLAKLPLGELPIVAPAQPKIKPEPQTFFKKNEGYLTRLINNSKPMQSKLKTLFHVTSSIDSFQWLFEVPLNQEERLITHLIRDPEKKKVLIDFLKQPENGSKLRTKDLFEKKLTYLKDEVTAFIFLVYLSDGHEILGALIDSNPKLVDEITYEQLTRFENSTQNTSNFYWLSSTDTGCEILISLFEKKPELLNAIKITDLIGESGSDLEAGCYPLFWLSVFESGKILAMLFEANENLCSEIPLAHLIKTFNHMEDSDTSALYWLSCHEVGKKLLNTLVTRNTEVFQGLRLNHFTRPISDKLEGYKYTAFYWLSNHNLISKLMEQNPKFLDGLDESNLCHIFPDKVSTFFHMAGSSLGKDILLKLFEKYPNLSQSIPAEVLYNQVKNNKPDRNTSSFYWFCVSIKGLDILELLFTNEALIQGLPLECLTSRGNKMDSGERNPSALYYLSKSKKGRLLLLQIVKKNSAIAVGLSAEALTRHLSSSAGKRENTSPLYWLTKDYGRQILQKCLDANPRLAQELKVSDLCRPRTALAGKFENDTPLYRLCANHEGQKILCKLIGENKNLVQIPINELVRLQKYGRHENLYPLHWLAMVPLGQTIFLQFLEIHPSTASFVMAPAITDAAKADKNRFFCQLVSTTVGCKVLELLLKLQPSLEEELKQILFLKAVIHEKHSTTLFKALAKSPEGLSIRNRLEAKKKIGVRSYTLFQPSKPTSLEEEPKINKDKFFS